MFRYAADEFMLTAAEPNLAYFRDLIGYDRVEIEEVTDQCGIAGDPGPAGARRARASWRPR